jgi:hypothetical protein
LPPSLEAGDDAPEDVTGAGGVFGLAPDVRAREAHGAIAESDNLEVAEADDGGAVSEGGNGLGRHGHPSNFTPVHDSLFDQRRSARSRSMIHGRTPLVAVESPGTGSPMSTSSQ